MVAQRDVWQHDIKQHDGQQHVYADLRWREQRCVLARDPAARLLTEERAARGESEASALSPVGMASAGCGVHRIYPDFHEGGVHCVTGYRKASARL